MAGTRLRRARDAQMSGAEELRFDFSGDGDEAVEPGGLSQPHASSPGREAEEEAIEEEQTGAPSVLPPCSPIAPASFSPSPATSAAASAPPGSASDTALSVSEFYDHVRGALKQ